MPGSKTTLQAYAVTLAKTKLWFTVRLIDGSFLFKYEKYYKASRQRSLKVSSAIFNALPDTLRNCQVGPEKSVFANPAMISGSGTHLKLRQEWFGPKRRLPLGSTTGKALLSNLKFVLNLCLVTEDYFAACISTQRSLRLPTSVPSEDKSNLESDACER